MVQTDWAAPDALWKQRYRLPILRAQVASANPARALVASNRSGLYQLYAADLRSGDLRQLTERPAGTLWGSISPDGRFVYYLDDQQGNELGHFIRLSFDGSLPPQDLTPQLPPYAGFSIAESRDGTLAGFTLPGSAGFALYVVPVQADNSCGTPRLLATLGYLVHGPALSADAGVAVWQATERSRTLDYNLLAFDSGSGRQIGELWDGDGSSVECGVFSPLPGDRRLLATSNRSGYKRPLIWDLRTGQRTDLRVDGLEGEIEAWEWSPDGAHILLCQTADAAQRLYLYDVDAATTRALQHPEGAFSGAVFGRPGEVLVRWQDSTHPIQLIALDSQSGRQTRTLLPVGAVPPSHPWRSVSFPSTDGEPIQGWLAVPDGAGPFPTILETHGGPTHAILNSFDPSSQAWLDRGFAYLTVNYRGSTKFGRAYEQIIWGDLGHWEVEDMVAGRAWLVEHGIARPDAVFVTGWSYGGYLTLQAMGLYPALWAGGMGGVVVADWTIQYEDETELLRGYDVALLKGTPQEQPEVYRAASPLTHVDKLQAPLLIIQGRNDTRDPPRQVEVYAERARALGKDVEVVWFETGHAGSAADTELAIAHQELMMRFAQRVLDARPRTPGA